MRGCGKLSTNACLDASLLCSTFLPILGSSLLLLATTTAQLPAPSRDRSHRHAPDGTDVHKVGDEVDDPSQLADLSEADGGDVADARQQLQGIVEALQKNAGKEKKHSQGAPRDGGWCLGSLHTEEAHLAELGRKQSKPHTQINGTASLFQLQSIFYPLLVHSTHQDLQQTATLRPHSADSAGARKNK